MSTTVALVSDLHGNLPALRAVLPRLREADEVVCAGDLVGYYPFPNEVARTAIEEGWRCVRGNHEEAVFDGAFDFNRKAAEAVEWTRENLQPEVEEWLRDLPVKRELEVEDVKIAVSHGSYGDTDRYVTPGVTDLEVSGLLERAATDALVLGHTHLPMERRVEQGLLVNPGSVGQPRDGDARASTALLEVDSDEVDVEFLREPYPYEELRGPIAEAGLPESSYDRLRRGR